MLEVVFCAFQSSLVRITLPEPEKTLVPDRVVTLMTPPVARPYSAVTPAVVTVISWIASKFRLAPQPPVAGSVVSAPSKSQRLLVNRPPWTLGLKLVPALVWTGTMFAPGAFEERTW